MKNKLYKELEYVQILNENCISELMELGVTDIEPKYVHGCAKHNSKTGNWTGSWEFKYVTVSVPKFVLDEPCFVTLGIGEILCRDRSGVFYKYHSWNHAMRECESFNPVHASSTPPLERGKLWHLPFQLKVFNRESIGIPYDKKAVLAYDSILDLPVIDNLDNWEGYQSFYFSNVSEFAPGDVVYMSSDVNDFTIWLMDKVGIVTDVIDKCFYNVITVRNGSDIIKLKDQSLSGYYKITY